MESEKTKVTLTAAEWYDVLDSIPESREYDDLYNELSEHLGGVSINNVTIELDSEDVDVVEKLHGKPIERD